MSPLKKCIPGNAIVIVVFLCASTALASSPVTSFLEQHCLSCHGSTDREPGAVDLSRIRSENSLVAAPELLQKMVDVLSDRMMPPDEASELSVEDRDV
ncbi:MAG TPA: hypothetical protein EYM79_09035, partial [Planctomycetes bacterium]|nr:hypothetical protein [Planctomycetota bacterium]